MVLNYNKEDDIFNSIIDKLNKLKNVNVSINRNNNHYPNTIHIQHGKRVYTGMESGITAKDCYNGKLDCQEDSRWKVDIVKIKYTINDKYVRRIYSRNSFKRNGRLYHAA